MKKKLLILASVGLVGMYFAPAIFAKTDNQPNSHKPIHATEVELIKKVSIPGKGKPPSHPSKPDKPNKKTSGAATGSIGAEVTGNKYAIVIGIADYKGEDNDLSYTIHDAEAMENVLTSKYGFLEGNIISLRNSDATSVNILGAIEALKGVVTPDSEVVFFYSGHGGIGIASDGDKEGKDESIYVYDRHLWDGELKTAFEGFDGRIVFFFDSCAAGGMDDLAGSGRIINMATQEKRFTTAIEDGSLGGGYGYGEFTYYFVVEGMGEGLADTTTTNGSVTVEEAFDYAKQETVSDHPTIYDGFTDDLLL